MAGQLQTWAGAIRSPADARQVLEQVNAGGVGKASTAALATAVQLGDDVELRPDATRLLPVDDQIRPLLPWSGLPRGSTVAAVGSTSLLLTLIAGAMRDGGWAACVGMAHLGVLAAVQDHRIPADRFALVPNPGPDWPQVVAALIDGVDLIAVGVPGPIADGLVRSLQARAREKGCVLVPTVRWPAANAVLEVTGRRWEGLGRGRGRLKRQTLQVRASGRGAAARPRTATVTLGEPLLDIAAALDALPPPAQPPVAVETNHPQAADRWPDRHASDEPADPWTDLLHHLPPIERKRPWH